MWFAIKDMEYVELRIPLILCSSLEGTAVFVAQGNGSWPQERQVTSLASRLEKGRRFALLTIHWQSSSVVLLLLHCRGVYHRPVGTVANTSRRSVSHEVSSVGKVKGRLGQKHWASQRNRTLGTCLSMHSPFSQKFFFFFTAYDELVWELNLLPCHLSLMHTSGKSVMKLWNICWAQSVT